MLANGSYEADVEFVKLLKVFESDLGKIPWKFVTTTYYPISDHLEKIFTIHVNIYGMTDADIENMMKFIGKHTRNDRVKSLILHRLIWFLRQSNADKHQLVGQTLLNKHVFKI